MNEKLENGLMSLEGFTFKCLEGLLGPLLSFENFLKLIDEI